MLDQHAKELIDGAVSRKSEAWAKTIKLTRSHARYAHFLEDVTQALHTCIERHVMEQDLFLRLALPTGGGILKEEAKEARDLAQRLRDFTRKYRHGTLVLTPGRLFDLAVPAQDLDKLATFLEISRTQAAGCRGCWRSNRWPQG
jgi:hypothetical protein